MEMLTAEITKQDWIDTYAGRIFKTWQSRQTPFAIDESYIEQLKKQLSDQFEDPLKRSLIETSY